jgi:hypothetical protein
MQPDHPIDISIKGLLRGQAPVLFRLLGQPESPSHWRWEDTALSLPELRADHVLVLGTAAEPDQGALYVEYQLAPDPANLATWAVKWSGLLRQLGLPTSLLVLYLERGAYATFPDRLAVNVAGVATELRFTAVCLWEHGDRIRSGELWQLAPLLVLCEDNPTEETVRREVELITGSPASPAEQADLLAFALRVGARDFSRVVLERVFREMLPMVRGATIIDDWIAEGEARGEARGETRGREGEARQMALRLLRRRFGDLPASLVSRVERLEVAECETLAERLVDGASLEQLFPS